MYNLLFIIYYYFCNYFLSFLFLSVRFFYRTTWRTTAVPSIREREEEEELEEDDDDDDAAWIR